MTTTTTTEGTAPYACTITTVTKNAGGFSSIQSLCIDCPEVPYIAGTPTQVLTDNLYGWNSSAYSAQQLDGDLYVQFNAPSCLGLALGFASERKSDNPRDLSHMFYINKSAGRETWVVAEGASTKTAPADRDPSTDTFRIERRNGVVRYLFNNRPVYVSAAPSYGPLVVVACMYAAGDGVN